MKISDKAWKNYIKRLAKINTSAAADVVSYMTKHDTSSYEGTKALIDYAYAISTKYGEAAAELSCQMYEEIAAASGVRIPAAEPAETATYGEVAKAIRGRMFDTKDPEAIGAAVGRTVKMAGVDTTMKNALRDGAEWAWIPSGDTCAFCLMLASNGWQKASKNAIRNGHAEHIHNNCDCTYAVRFDGISTVEGYDPEGLYDEYIEAGSTRQERLNAIRRKLYAKDPEKYRAQSRAAYAKRIERERYYGKGKNIFVDSKVIGGQEYRMKFRGMAGDPAVDDTICNYSRQILKHRSGTYQEDLVLLDADTGRLIFYHDKGGVNSGVDYDKALQDAIDNAHAEGKRILAIHNHPNSLPPTMDDGVSALEHGYDVGVVACHDGTVYTYSPAGYRLTKIECEMIHNAISYQIETGATIEDVWYNMLEEYGMKVQRR